MNPTITVNGTEAKVDVDVHIQLAGESPLATDPDTIWRSEDIPERLLTIRFTSEAIIIDAFVNGEFVGTSAEGYDDLIERLA